MVMYCSVRSMYGYVLLCEVNVWLDAWQQSCGRIVMMSPTHIILLIFIFLFFNVSDANLRLTLFVCKTSIYLSMFFCLCVCHVPR